MTGLMDGIANQVPALKAQLGAITGIVAGTGMTAAIAAGSSGVLTPALMAGTATSSSGHVDIDYDRLAAAIAAAMGDTKLIVDGRELARAVTGGQRRLDRQG